MATPMRSLTDQSGLKFSSLATTVALAAARHAPQPDQRRVADRLGDVVVDPPTTRGPVGRTLHDHLLQNTSGFVTEKTRPRHIHRSPGQSATPDKSERMHRA